YSHVDGGALNLPLGRDTVIYTAFDDCHNVTSDTIFIDVVDESAPIMICKEYVSVSLSNDSGVRLPALSVNNGSFDDCTMESLCLTRMVDISRFDELRDLNVGGVLSDGMDYVPLDSMTGVCGRIFEKSGTLNGIDYIVKDDLCSTNIEYCCADGGAQDTVVLRGIDENGNANQCMARIDIQDKRRPILHCPPDITIDCEYDIITDSTYSIFGNLVKPGEQNAIDLPEDMVLGVESGKSLVDGVWSGNCEGQVNVVAQRVADKCSAGTIERTFTVIANGYTVSCVQTITITRADTLDIKDIQFPSDTTIHACGVASDAEPDIIGRPIISEDGCSLLGDAHSDLMVRKNNSTGDACLSIIREWTIIDWCAEPAKVISTKSQIITLKDTIAPVLSNAGVCLDTIVQASSCDNGLISLTQRGSDLCTSPENLVWTVDIDLNNDGSIDQNFNVTPSEENNESVATLTSSFAHGQHKAIWKLNDQCGNTVVCEQLFTVIYSISPDAICRTSITGPLSQVIGGGSQIEVWANEYNIGSSDHTCGYDIIYSFASDSFAPSKTLTCADYNPLAGVDSSIVDMDIYILAVIETENNGIKDTLIISSSLCHSNFILYDSHNTCLAPVLNDPDITNTNKALIAGKVKTEKGINIPTVEVLLKGTNTSESNLGAITDVDGTYAFPTMELGDSYNIVPSLDKDILNGVSTLDLVLIQKHILGLERLETPYKIIAADVNNDQSISAIDMIELRKVILNV
ncbi:MAG: dockerin type I domain-containing protein, partial [Saprospiraceae bacterium]|nr:dockerin type I domain-containing protein [Saprospiraceae bacterium]